MLTKGEDCERFERVLYPVVAWLVTHAMMSQTCTVDPKQWSRFLEQISSIMSRKCTVDSDSIRVKIFA